MPSVQPYLVFSGNCEEAIKFYCNVFNGDIKLIQKFKEAPIEFPSSWKDKIMHSSFVIKDSIIMASDHNPEKAVVMGNNIHLSISYDKNNNPDEHFKKLSEGGTVTKPLQNTFWGARYGQLIDRFGQHWMFNQELD